MRNVLILAHLHNIQRLMQPIKIRQFRQKAQNQRQFGRGMVANLSLFNIPWLALNNFISHCRIAFLAPVEHASRNWYFDINIIINYDFPFGMMNTM